MGGKWTLFIEAGHVKRHVKSKFGAKAVRDAIRVREHLLRLLTFPKIADGDADGFS